MAATLPDWYTRFAADLAIRDRREKAFDDIITAYTTLAARIHAAPTPAQESAAITHLRSQLEAKERERARYERRCRDLAEEARTKDRQFQNVQDENVALELELNMALKRERELKADNQELLDRWMRLKREEADEMNRASRWE